MDGKVIKKLLSAVNTLFWYLSPLKTTFSCSFKYLAAVKYMDMDCDVAL